MAVTSEKTLVVAVILASDRVPHWHAIALQRLHQLPFVRVPLAIVHSSCVQRSRPFASHLGGCLYSLLDSKILGQIARARDPNQLVHARHWLPGSKWVVSPPCERDLDPATLKMLGDCSPDVILQLGGPRLYDEASRIPRFGLWYYRHAGAIDSAADGAFFRVLHRGSRTIESTLEARTPRGNRVLFASWTAVNQYCLMLTKARSYWKAATFPAHQLRRMHANLPAGPEVSDCCETDGDIRDPNEINAPSPPRFLLRQGMRLISKGAGRLFGQSAWQIGVRIRKAWTVDNFRNPDSEGFLPVNVPGNSFLADPFLLEHEGRQYIFCEEFNQRRGRGVISWIEVLDDQTVTTPRIALERPYHLSYPFLFRDLGALFMIPETSQRRAIELYRCVKFPDCWELECVLLWGVAAVDTTIVQLEGRYWLFTCLKEETADTSDELHVYWSESLHGPWIAHKRNPVISDVRSARPAGSFIRLGDTLLRPSQDCSERYGSRINFNRVLLLSECEYKEERLGSLGGNWNPKTLGAHTWNCNGRLEVTDGPLWQPRRPIRLLSEKVKGLSLRRYSSSASIAAGWQ